MFSRARKTPVAEWWWTIDRPLLACLMLLLLFGVVLSFAASPPVAERLGLSPWYFITRHLIIAPVAFCVLVAASFLNPHQVRLGALIVLVVSMVLLLGTLFFGDEVKGATRWITFAGQSFQPSEFVKPTFAVMAGWLLSEKFRHREIPAHTIVLALLGTIIAMLLLQPDVGQTALMLGTWAALLFLAGISWWLIGMLFAAAVAGGFSAYAIFPHVARRIDTFLNPDAGNSYQVDKALQSLLEGGWFGRGPGEGLAKRYLPDAHADYVFSAAAGEFGILFCMLLVALICYIVIRALSNAQSHSSLFVRLTAGALAIQFGLQSAINLAVNLDLMPPKGMTLPFVSYGGTSMIAVAFGMGLMLALTRKKPEERLSTGLPAYRGIEAERA